MLWLYTLIDVDHSISLVDQNEVRDDKVHAESWSVCELEKQRAIWGNEESTGFALWQQR